MANGNQRGTSVKAAVARTRWQRRKKIATRRTIRDTALRLFDECGYDKVTMQRIADEAGMSAITVFRYFPTKEDLVIGFSVDGEPFVDLRQEIGRHMDPSPRDFVRRVAPQVLGSLESEQLEGLALRLRIVRSNEALLSALYARVPRWTAAVAAIWEGKDVVGFGEPGVADGSAPSPSVPSGIAGDDGVAEFSVRLSVSCIIGCVLETLLEWSRLCDVGGDSCDKADVLTSVVSDAMDTVLR
ncbi:TetR/AcrR family transcriptional regulator [Bifidobacterium sp. MA2]|uniref:TetR/AcrR family transcriptional regulator n=1 Tax=Bifidobacterium santillanense TaxID=2809028 RepID=A0ABS5UM15_9BIFI|nr:TetR/AcrR family transcriptional regulator [Bifidobacterium santillanense]MBT1171953.1 TetR/AcrR family transcriptional regulator [Bifidobacterium santillanense]